MALPTVDLTYGSGWNAEYKPIRSMCRKNLPILMIISLGSIPVMDG